MFWENILTITVACSSCMCQAQLCILGGGSKRQSQFAHRATSQLFRSVRAPPDARLSLISVSILYILTPCVFTGGGCSIKCSTADKLIVLTPKHKPGKVNVRVLVDGHVVSAKNRTISYLFTELVSVKNRTIFNPVHSVKAVSRGNEYHGFSDTDTITFISSLAKIVVRYCMSSSHFQSRNQYCI